MSSSDTPKTSGSGLLDPVNVVQTLPLTPGMQVADFGCGSGHFTILIAERVGNEGHVTAIDILEAPLDSVRSRAKEKNLANIDYIRADLEVTGSTRLADNSQDVVLLANILFQSKKKDAILREAKRVLKEGGSLVLIEWKKGTGGFGPPDELRLEEHDIATLMSQEGFSPRNDIDVGRFHHVLSFTKTPAH